MEGIIFDSRKLKYKSPFGCAYEGEKINVSIYIPHSRAVLYACLCFEGEESLEFRLIPSGRDGEYNIYSAEFEIEKKGLYFYWFELDGEKHLNNGEKWQLSVLRKGFDTPDWLKGAVMYQIFPDRFNKEGECDLTGKLEPYTIHTDFHDTPLFRPVDGEILNNDFFGGNIKGITAKLDYLSELSVSVLYLNPLFYSYSNHRYDTADYMRIDPMAGTEEDFRELCEKAHKKGMKIILDVAFSHTGSNSIYFDKKNIFGNGAVSNPDSPYREWYTFESYPEKYESWWGIDTLPQVRELNPSYLSYITGEGGVAEKYLKLGADGFRLDVADELPDEFIKALRERTRIVKPDAVLIGEVWEDASNKISYGVRKKYFTECELDSIMNYPLRTAILEFVKGHTNADYVENTVSMLRENYPGNVFLSLMNSLSTHDTLRALTFFDAENTEITKEEQAVYRVKDYEEAKNKLKLAAFMQYFLPGCPTVYYGDEAGAQGFRDPFNRGFFPWDSIDNELLSFFKELGEARKKYKALRVGDVFFKREGEKVLSFSRKYECEQNVNCIANLSQGVYNLRIKGGKTVVMHKCLITDGLCLIEPGGFYACTSDN